MSSAFFERTRRVASLALRVVDDITSNYVRGGDARLSNARYYRKAITKSDGFYVFADIVPGSYDLSIEADGYENYEQNVDLPLSGSVVLEVPGENEVMLSVSDSNTATEVVEFAAKHFFPAAPTGTMVISSRRISSLAENLEGEGISMATLDEVGSGASRIRRRDVLRLVGEPLIRLRPAPHYRFDRQLRRLSGTVRDVASSEPIVDASVTLTRIGSETVNFEDVGTMPDNTVRVYTLGNTAATKRVIGVTRDVQKLTNGRGQYVFYFPWRPDLIIDQVTLTATATGYVSAPPTDVNLTLRANSTENFDLNRI